MFLKSTTATGFKFVITLFILLLSASHAHAHAFARAPVVELPIVKITTENKAPVSDTETTLNASMEIPAQPGLDPAFVFKGDITIKGHGNSTWGMPKHPYRVKLKSKASLLGMPKESNFTFLANYSDKSMLRNDTAFEISRRVGMAYTPRSVFVELYLNDEYLGVYQIAEKVEFSPSRLNVQQMKPTDLSGDALTGGYLLEIDHKRRWEETGFDTSRGVMITVKEPSKIAPEQLAYIQDTIQKAEDTLFGPDFADPTKGYAQYFDVDALVNWYLINELTKNNDAIFWSSVYLYKERNGKLTFGPAWDFDIALGNCDYNGMEDPTGWWIRRATWYEQLFKDPVFSEKVSARWKQLKKTQFDTLLKYIDERAMMMESAQKRNFTTWPILDQYVWPNAKVTGSYAGEIDYLKSYLADRIRWMDLELGK